MKRILIISGSAPPLKCGVGYYGEMLINELAIDNEVHFLTTNGLGKNIPDLQSLHHISNWKIKKIKAMMSVIRTVQPEVIHIQYPAVGYKRDLGINLLAFWLRVRMPRIAVVVTLHEYYGSALLGKIRNIITVIAAKKIIVSNLYDKDAMPRILRKKIAVVPIGHTFKKVAPNKETYLRVLESAGFSSNIPTIAYFGFVNPSKGIDVLINSAKDIRAQILLLTELQQSNPYQHYIHSLIQTAKKDGAKIHLTGFLNNKDLSHVLSECTIFALPQPLPLTAKSSTSIVAAEHGLIVVSTAAKKPVYNLPYINDKNAVLIDAMNEESFSGACNNLLADKKRMDTLKAGNPELVNNFAWPSIAKQHSKIYNSIS